MAFPVEGWRASAAVVVHPRAATLALAVHTPPTEAAAARKQALAALSLDVDGTGWPLVGRRDAVIGALQRRYGALRPVLFHSPYEAAAHFVIGHRISMKQARAIRARLAIDHGDAIDLGDTQVHAFPRPSVVTGLRAYPGLSAEKLERLRGVARAAEAGTLDRARLRRLPIPEALASLRTIRGIGEFFAQGILFRGAGIVDDITHDDQLRRAVRQAYRLEDLPSPAALDALAGHWRPFRMWAEVLLVVELFREGRYR